MIEHKKDAFDIALEALRENSSGLNDEQLDAVTETRNVVVTAGAGSGKTTVLASRFAYLVEAKNIPVDRILTLTFTRKAATEMKERIFYGLKNHSNGMDIKGKNPVNKNQPHYDLIVSRARSALESFDKAHIQTLDSYYSDIARKGSSLYGITPDFSLDDERLSTSVRALAMRFVLEHISTDCIHQLSQKVELQDIGDTVFAETVLKNSTVLSPIDFDSQLELQRQRILRDYKKILRGNNAAVEKISESILACTPAFQEGWTSVISQPVAPPSFEVLGTADSQPSARIREYSEYIKDCSKSGSKPVMDGTDSPKQLVRRGLETLSENSYLLSCIALYVDEYPLVVELYSLLKEFQEQVTQLKISQSLLSFADVSELALRLLCERQEIRSVEQKKFDAIMIDEFQDDNQLQCDTLLVLSDNDERLDADGSYIIPSLASPELGQRLDPSKLFFVGDEKQSIYSFRGADVSVFKSLKDSEFFVKKVLSLNYRSDAELIRGFNEIFGGTPDFTPLFMDGAWSPDYEAVYEPAKIPEEKLKAADFSKKKITVGLFPRNAAQAVGGAAAEGDASELLDKKMNEIEGMYVANKIKRLIADSNGRYSCKDFTLLFRTSSPTGAYEKALLSAGIPYSTEVYKGFFSDGPVNDILSLLKICAYPADSNSFARFLRSPFVGLSLDELYSVCATFSLPFARPFDFAEGAEFPEETLSRLRQGRSLYEAVRKRLQSEPLTKVISFLWYEAGYRYETLWNSEVSMFTSSYDILFEMARKAEGKVQSLSEFIDEVRTYEASDTKLENLDVPLESNDAVRILTIHGSKGLEFPFVFVCGISNPPGVRPRAVSYDREFGLLLYNPASDGRENYFQVIRKEELESLECAELRRLAYVAFTRAMHSLYLVGNYSGDFTDKDQKKCAKRFAVHKPSSRHFTVLGKKGRELFREYENPRYIYELLLPMLEECTKNAEPPETDARNPEDAPEPVKKVETSYSPFYYEEDPGLFIPEKKDRRRLGPFELTKEAFISEFFPLYERAEATLNASDGAAKRKAYLLPSKLVHPACTGQKFEFADPGYVFINKLVVSSIPNLTDADSTAALEAIVDDGSEEDSDEAFCVEAALSQKPQPKFTLANFGTIAHLFMQNKLLGITDFSLPQNAISGLDSSVCGIKEVLSWDYGTTDLRERKICRVREICSRMAELFEGSELYGQAVSSEWLRTEYDFRSCLKSADIIVKGQIDLVYKKNVQVEGKNYRYTIVDYKTNQTVAPELYYNQLSCYKAAVAAMTGCPEDEIRCVLYYLRFARAVDISEFCSSSELEKAADAWQKHPSATAAAICVCKGNVQ